MKTKLLRQMIRKILLENHTSLITEGLKFNELPQLALWRGRTGDGESYVLYDPVALKKEIMLFNKNTREKMPESMLGYFGLDSKAIKGIIAIYPDNWNPCNGAKYVSGVASDTGHGPTLYDIAMGFEPDGIMSDRESVSKSAYEVWKYYYNNRPDIEKRPLDDRDKKWTDDPSDDCEHGAYGAYFKGWPETHEEFLTDPLNWTYNRGEVPGSRQSMKNHQDFVEDMTYQGVVLKDNWFAKLSDQYFQNRWDEEEGP